MAFISRSLLKRTLWAEDWTILVSLICFAVAISFVVRTYIVESLHVVVLGLAQIALILFYLRHFPQAWFRCTAFLVMGLIASSTVAMLILTLIQCRPIPYLWHKDIRSGTCLDPNTLAFAKAGLSIGLNIITITLPIPVLAGMTFVRQVKISILLMFTIGSFGCIASIFHLQSLLSVKNSNDTTWDRVPAFIWTTIELATALVCSCLPAIRQLFCQVTCKSPSRSLRVSSSLFQVPLAFRKQRTTETEKSQNLGAHRNRLRKKSLPTHQTEDARRNTALVDTSRSNNVLLIDDWYYHDDKVYAGPVNIDVTTARKGPILAKNLTRGDGRWYTASRTHKALVKDKPLPRLPSEQVSGSAGLDEFSSSLIFPRSYTLSQNHHLSPLPTQLRLT
ncbi:CFEM domain-containing protein [Phlyctema vagabunda]|uniref:CFEM domain-containing protein n=1 Tax=Phlyctema vagabunda TaxID=108571 RepID=A0ABR4PE97_9HELO